MLMTMVVTLAVQGPLITVAPPPKIPTAESGFFATGADFLDTCKEDVTRCGWYVMAVSDHISLQQLAGTRERILCIPPDVNLGGVTKSVIETLNKPAERLDDPAVVLVHNALVSAYRC